MKPARGPSEWGPAVARWLLWLALWAGGALCPGAESAGPALGAPAPDASESRSMLQVLSPAGNAPGRCRRGDVVQTRQPDRPSAAPTNPTVPSQGLRPVHLRHARPRQRPPSCCLGNTRAVRRGGPSGRLPSLPHGLRAGGLRPLACRDSCFACHIRRCSQVSREAPRWWDSHPGVVTLPPENRSQGKCILQSSSRI